MREKGKAGGAIGASVRGIATRIPHRSAGIELDANDLVVTLYTNRNGNGGRIQKWAMGNELWANSSGSMIRFSRGLHTNITARQRRRQISS